MSNYRLIPLSIVDENPELLKRVEILQRPPRAIIDTINNLLSQAYHRQIRLQSASTYNTSNGIADIRYTQLPEFEHRAYVVVNISAISDLILRSIPILRQYTHPVSDRVLNVNTEPTDVTNEAATIDIAEMGGAWSRARYMLRPTTNGPPFYPLQANPPPNFRPWTTVRVRTDDTIEIPDED